MTTQVNGLDQLAQFVGQHLGYSPYIKITQEQVQLFADATGSHQWIHTDVEKAKTGPFGGTIAHGYLTLSLGPTLLPGIFSVSGISMGINYGTNKVRFIDPVKVGSQLRAGAKLVSVDEIVGGAQVVLEMTFECEGATKPSCVAEVIVRYYR